MNRRKQSVQVKFNFVGNTQRDRKLRELLVIVVLRGEKGDVGKNLTLHQFPQHTLPSQKKKKKEMITNILQSDKVITFDHLGFVVL